MTLTANQEKWVLALESGDYEQTDGILHSDDGYCCLGVACDVSGLGSWGEIPDADNDVDEIGRLFTEHDSRSIKETDLGPDVVRWLRLRSSLGYFETHDSFDQPESGPETLTEMNDDGSWSFESIAKYIREHPEDVFEQ